MNFWSPRCTANKDDELDETRIKTGNQKNCYELCGMDIADRMTPDRLHSGRGIFSRTQEHCHVW